MPSNHKPSSSISVQVLRIPARIRHPSIRKSSGTQRHVKSSQSFAFGTAEGLRYCLSPWTLGQNIRGLKISFDWRSLAEYPQCVSQPEYLRRGPIPTRLARAMELGTRPAAGRQEANETRSIRRIAVPPPDKLDQEPGQSWRLNVQRPTLEMPCRTKVRSEPTLPEAQSHQLCGSPDA